MSTYRLDKLFSPQSIALVGASPYGTLCTPLLVFPASYLLFRKQERITSRLLVGTALALGGIAVIVSR